MGAIHTPTPPADTAVAAWRPVTRKATGPVPGAPPIAPARPGAMGSRLQADGATDPRELGAGWEPVGVGRERPARLQWSPHGRSSGWIPATSWHYGRATTKLLAVTRASSTARGVGRSTSASTRRNRTRYAPGTESITVNRGRADALVNPATETVLRIEH
jgi:hypothetical protein